MNLTFFASFPNMFNSSHGNWKLWSHHNCISLMQFSIDTFFAVEHYKWLGVLHYWLLLSSLADLEGLQLPCFLNLHSWFLLVKLKMMRYYNIINNFNFNQRLIYHDEKQRTFNVWINFCIHVYTYSTLKWCINNYCIKNKGN